MAQEHEKQIEHLFAVSETELPGEDFGDRVMIKVNQQKRKDTLLSVGYRVLVLLCCCSILPLAIKGALALGDIIGNSPFLLKTFLLSHSDSPMLTAVLLTSVGYLLFKSRLLRLPSLDLTRGLYPGPMRKE